MCVTYSLQRYIGIQQAQHGNAFTKVSRFHLLHFSLDLIQLHVPSKQPKQEAGWSHKSHVGIVHVAGSIETVARLDATVAVASTASQLSRKEMCLRFQDGSHALVLGQHVVVADSPWHTARVPVVVLVVLALQHLALCRIIEPAVLV